MYGRIIRQYRMARGFTQKELAYMMHVSEKTISSWEVDRTEPNIGNIEALAVCLGVKKSALIGEELTEQNLSAKEMALLTAYRLASKDTRSAVEAILKV